MYSSRNYGIKKSDKEKLQCSYLELADNVNKHDDKLQDDAKLDTTKNHIDIPKDVNLCKDLREYKLTETLTQKRRQQLRANSHELRELERQLQSALAFSQLKEQQEGIARIKEEEFRKKQEENAKFELECELIRKSILEQEKQERQKKLILLETLKSQISEQQQKRRLDFEDVNKDRDEILKLMKQIQSEKIAEREEAAQLRERYRKEMEESLRNIKLRQQLEKERNIIDDERNVAYQKECDNLKLQEFAERKRIQRKKEARVEHLGQQLATLNQDKEKRENLILTLSLEEHKAKKDHDFRSALVEQKNKREKLRIEMENYRHKTQIEKQKQFLEEERRFHEQHIRYLEEQDKLDQLSDEKRRRKKIEHIKALREMIESRRYQKANEIAARIFDLEKTINDEKKSDQLIQEERISILGSVPKELLSYLPAGTLKSSDKEFLSLPVQIS